VAAKNGKADGVFEDLQRRILSGELEPGERLVPERELAVAYGTNRNTLREAVRRLEEKGLVRARQGQGVTVQDWRENGTLELLLPWLEGGVDAAERVAVLEDLLEARAHTMALVVSRAARAAGPEDVSRLRELALRQADAFARGDLAALAQGDLAWLDALVDAAHSLTMRWIANTFLRIYRRVLDRFPSLWIAEPGYPETLEALVAAIARRDEDLAREALRDFFARTDETLLDLVRRLAEPRPRAEEAHDGA
jgi:GntR family transcriptional repressor for pyruvate dehydrogenase complex